ncbi:MAG TPA: tRNA-dihydrouridine synthase family protein [Spirochaetales bacterium]|nr:tRNA-dihydrouridine synthase family protein [Spirochaetales bacterium]HRY55307.1 tRNA-dihydrouridine synthase family protein [Spirochaetia bacterium]HRZ64337.1 tRNA-dihydrouridine synthase family protein [Spirochaetia bacterium]
MQPFLYLAPLHGVTNRLFRRIYFRHFPGFDAAIAPFILATRSAGSQASHFKDLAPREEPGPRLVPQLLGNEASAFVATAAVLADLGYDEVDWNLGCPFPVVANKRRGSGLLPFPELVASFLDEACARSRLPVSVKLRLGRRDPGEILELMPILNAHPLARVILHPRLGVQMYRGEVDLEGFARAAGLCAHELVYNGDIRDEAGFARLRATFPGIREWMLGRGAIADPFLPARLKGSDPGTRRTEALLAFHDELYAGYRGILHGPAHVLDKMKEVWGYLGASFPNSGHLLGRISQARTIEAYERAVRRLFSAPRG